MTSEAQKLKDARAAVTDALPDAAASAGVASVTSPTGDSMSTRSVSEMLKDRAALRHAELVERNAGRPIVLIPRHHRA